MMKVFSFANLAKVAFFSVFMCFLAKLLTTTPKKYSVMLTQIGLLF